MNLYQFKPFK